MEAIDLAEDLNSLRSVGLVHDLTRQLEPHAKVPVVQEFRERTKGLTEGQM